MNHNVNIPIDMKSTAEVLWCQTIFFLPYKCSYSKELWQFLPIYYFSSLSVPTKTTSDCGLKVGQIWGGSLVLERIKYITLVISRLDNKCTFKKEPLDAASPSDNTKEEKPTLRWYIIHFFTSKFLASLIAGTVLVFNTLFV